MPGATTNIDGYTILSREPETEIITYQASCPDGTRRVLLHVFPEGLEPDLQADLISKLMHLMETADTRSRTIVLDVNLHHQPPFIVTETALGGSTLREWVESELHAREPMQGATSAIHTARQRIGSFLQTLQTRTFGFKASVVTKRFLHTASTKLWATRVVGNRSGKSAMEPENKRMQ